MRGPTTSGMGLKLAIDMLAVPFMVKTYGTARHMVIVYY